MVENPSHVSHLSPDIILREWHSWTKFYMTPSRFTQRRRRIQSGSYYHISEEGSQTPIPCQVAGISDIWQLVGTSKKFKTCRGDPFILQSWSSTMMDTFCSLLILIIFLCLIVLLLLALLIWTWTAAKAYEWHIRTMFALIQSAFNTPICLPWTSFQLTPLSTPRPIYILQYPPMPTYPPPLPRLSIQTTPNLITGISLCTHQNSSSSLWQPLKYCNSSCNLPMHKKMLSSPL